MLKIGTATIFIICLLFSGCAQKKLHKQTLMAMGTLIEITVADKDKSPAVIKRAMDKAFARIQEIENLMSNYKEESDVSRLNKAKPGERILVSEETQEVLKRSLKLNKDTGGAFDITVFPLMRLWGFSDKHTSEQTFSLPSPEVVEEVLRLVGSDKIIIEHRKVGFALSGMGIDLGGIAKGYAVDKAIESLRQSGIKNALVNAGGDIFCLGQKSSDEQWNIGIQHPREPKQILTSLKLKDRAIATSGDYEKYLVVKNKRINHIIDPHTGFPVEEVPISVTVLTKDCTMADGLATAVFVLGPEKGLHLINALEDTEAIIVSKQGGDFKIDVSDGFKKGSGGYPLLVQD